MSHIEFPELTPEARASVDAFYNAGLFDSSRGDRRRFAAFLREAMKQVFAANRPFNNWKKLEAIADNLHSFPPPPPTLAQAREAARQLGGANAEVVHAFLATLGEP